MKIKKTVISSFGESSSSFRPGVKTLFHKVSFFLRHTVEGMTKYNKYSKQIKIEKKQTPNKANRPNKPSLPNRTNKPNIPNRLNR